MEPSFSSLAVYLENKILLLPLYISGCQYDHIYLFNIHDKKFSQLLLERISYRNTLQKVADPDC